MSVDEKQREPLIGTAPNAPLLCNPRWLIWPDTHNYDDPSRTNFKIKNTDSYTNVFCLKVKHQVMMFSHAYGVLAPGEEKIIKMYLLNCEDWPKEGFDYFNSPIKLAVENLRVEGKVDTTNMRELEKKHFGRDVFRRTSLENPNQRMYHKMTIYLEKKDELDLPPVKAKKLTYEVC